MNEALRSHWRDNHRKTQELRKAAFWHWRQALGPPSKDKHLPLLTVNVWPRYKDKRLADVGAGMPMLKAVIDGLVDTKWIRDDNPEFIQRIIFHAPTWHHTENSTYITLTSEHGSGPPTPPYPLGQMTRDEAIRVEAEKTAEILTRIAERPDASIPAGNGKNKGEG